MSHATTSRPLVILRGELPPSRSCATRRWLFIRHQPGGFIGRLWITTGRKSEEYLLDEDDTVAEYSPGFRSFIIARQTGPFTDNKQGLYAVTVSPSGAYRCTCTGDAARGSPGACKHADTIRALNKAGQLPARGVTPPPTAKIKIGA